MHIHDKECAEDIAQETFVKFLEAIMRDTDIKKIKGYLDSTAGNLVKNSYKKNKEVPTDQVPDIEENNLEGVEARMDIEYALDRLPEEIKETAVLFFFQGMKQKEISDLLNIKLSLVKYRVSRAKELLSKQLVVERS